MLTIGSFPYSPGANPYQELFTKGLESNGLAVKRLSPLKWNPLARALTQKVDLLQLDWHYDWYSGRNFWTNSIKYLQYTRSLRKKPRIPLVWTAHNVLPHDSLKPDYDRRMTQLLISRCDGIVGLSRSSLERIRNTYRIPDNCQQIAIKHGHYVDCYPNAISKHEARKLLGIPNDLFLFATVGSILPYKGHEKLIDCFATLVQENCGLLIAGKPKSPAFEESLRQRIKLLPNKAKAFFRPGFVPDEQLQNYFNAADVAIYPFSEILNSGSVLLALSFGKSVISPELGSIPETVPPDLLFPFSPSNIDSLSCAMRTALERRDALPPPSQVIPRVRHDFSWSECTKPLVAFYNKLLLSRCGLR